jgi:Flp pilus assembly pilin Flp
MLKMLLNDEAGFIISAELVLVATLLVIGMIVGLSEVQHAVVSELNDVADAIGELNQAYSFSGFHKRDNRGCFHAATYGSNFADTTDDCDDNQCQIACDAPSNETAKR